MDDNKLTKLDIVKLTFPFTRAQHEFLQGYVYIKEEAITQRLDSIDPNWSFSIDQAYTIGDSAVANATLMVKGVRRSNTGGNPIQRDKKDDKGVYHELPLYSQADNGVNAAKAAATDALKRCARLFGIGRYLLNAPKEGRAFEDWLAKQHEQALVQFKALTEEEGADVLRSVDVETGEIARPTPAAQSTPPARSASGASTDALASVAAEQGGTVTDLPDGKMTSGLDLTFDSVKAYFKNAPHFKSWLDKHKTELFTMTLPDAINFAAWRNWYYDRETVKRFFFVAETDYNLTEREVFEALSNANPNAKPVQVLVNDWSGDRDYASASLLAYKGGYDEKYIRTEAKELKREQHIDGALEIARMYNERVQAKAVQS